MCSYIFTYSPDGKRFRSRKEIARYLEKQGRAVDVGLFDFRRVDFTRDPCKRREHHTPVPEKRGKHDRHLQSAVTVVVNDKVSQQKLQNTFMVTIPLQRPHGMVQLPVIVAGAAEPGANNCNNNNGLKVLPSPVPLDTTTPNGVKPEACTKSPTSLGNIVQKLWERQLKKPEEMERKPQVHFQAPLQSQGLKQHSDMPLDVQSTASSAPSTRTSPSQSSSSSSAKRPLTMPRLQTPVTTSIGGLCMPALKPSSTCVSTSTPMGPTPTSWLQQQLVSLPTLNRCAPRPAPLPLSVSSQPVPTNAETQLQTSPVLFRPHPLMQPLSPQNGHVFSAGAPFSLPYHPALLNYMMMPKSPAVPILMTPPATPPRLNNFVSFTAPNQLTSLPSNFKLSRLPFVTSAI